MARVISIVCQKGGVGKTSSSVNLGVGLARRGKKVLLIDADSQGSLSLSLGFTDTKRLTDTIASIMSKIISESPVDPAKGILKHTEGVYVLPANNDLAAMEMFLVNVYGRESIMREYINLISPEYDYIKAISLVSRSFKVHLYNRLLFVYHLFSLYIVYQ